MLRAASGAVLELKEVAFRSLVLILTPYGLQFVQKLRQGLLVSYRPLAARSGSFSLSRECLEIRKVRGFARKASTQTRVT